MNHRVVLFLMVCNGTRADSLIAQTLLTFLITAQHRLHPGTIFNHHRGNHLGPILPRRLLMKSTVIRRLALIKKSHLLNALTDLRDK